MKRNIIQISQYEDMMQFQEFSKKIPKLNFPEDWDITILPPFGGAMIRFVVTVKTAKVSVYLDCHDNLGVVGQPYWEMYPLQDDTFRCMMDDVESLFDAINQSIKAQIS